MDPDIERAYRQHVAGLHRRFFRRSTSASPRVSFSLALTERQLSILILRLEGLSYRKIGALLSLDPTTVRWHLRALAAVFSAIRSQGKSSDLSRLSMRRRGGGSPPESDAPSSSPTSE
jgi:DNA-binding CsgD family transcriptional regulator